MDLYALTPRERVFHIDDECYLLYLGSDRDDDRPFARIGNSRKLTGRMIDNISSIIITDSLTGNPLIEPENINPNAMGAVQYVGDKKTVQNYLDFIHNYNVQDGHISSLEDIKKSHDRAEVLFFKDGNARLQYDRMQLFDLKRLEKQDLHFIEGAIKLKSVLTENNLRYTPEDFGAPGFFVEGGNFFLFQNQKIAAFGLPDTYFETLVSRGIDPDWIDTVISDKVTDSLIQLFKRKQATGEKIRILTGNQKMMHSAVQLFRGGQRNPLKAEIETFTSGDKKKYGRYTIEKRENTIITHPHLPFSLCIAPRQTRPAEKEMSIIPTGRSMLPPPGSFRKKSVPLTDGVPYMFLQKLRWTEHELVERFFNEIKPLCEYMPSKTGGLPSLAQDEVMLMNMFSRFFDDIRGNRFSRATADTLYRHLKKIKPKDGCLICTLTNIAGITLRFAASAPAEDTHGILKRIAERCDRITDISSPHLPLVGELSIEKDTIQLFYRTTRLSVTREDCTGFQESIAETRARHEEQKKIYDADIERLNALLDELESGAREEAAVTREAREATGAGAVHPGKVTVPGVEAVSVGGLGIPAGLRKGRRKQKRGAPSGGETEARVSVAGLGIPAGRRKDAEESKRGRNIKILIPVAVVAVAAVVFAALLFIPETKLHDTIYGGSEVEKGTEGTASQTSTASTGAEGAQQKEGVFSISVGDESSPYRIEVQITMLDIYYLTNKIAVKNGYRKIDSPANAGRDPDWIYPGNLFVLPDETRYTVVKGDTMWDMAHRFIKKTLENDWQVYVRIAEEIDNPDKRTHDRETLKNELESLKRRSYSENFSREIDKKIAKLGGEQ
jgi:hypothetical protein